MSFVATEIIVHVLYKYFNILLLSRCFIETEIIVCVFYNCLIYFFCFHQGILYPLFFPIQIHISRIYVFHIYTLLFFITQIGIYIYIYIWFLINMSFTYIYILLFSIIPIYIYGSIWYVYTILHWCIYIYKYSSIYFTMWCSMVTRNITCSINITSLRCISPSYL